MKLIKQEEVDKAALNHLIHFPSNNRIIRERTINNFKAGVEFAEKEFSKMFPNGFESWYETFYEIVAEITFWRHDPYPPLKIKNIADEYGTGGLYELAKELTDKFELLYKDREWDGEFFEEISEFLETELNKE